MVNKFICIGGGLTGTKMVKSRLFKKAKENDLKVIHIKDIQINTMTKNCLYLFIKFLPKLKILKELIKNKNKIIYEPLDFNYKIFDDFSKYTEENKGITLVHKLICPSFFMKKIFEKKLNIKKIFVNYHEYDKRFESTNEISNEILYIGGLNKTDLTLELIKKYNIKHIHGVDNEDLFKNKYDICIHIDYIKSSHSYFKLHTSTKLSTCLKFNSIFICSPVPVYLELLGENYELYIKEDLSNIDECITKAKEILNSETKYQEYLLLMNNIKDKLSPKSIFQTYLNILK